MRLWEIREGYDPDERMEMRGSESAEMAYQEGCRHGYKKGYGDAMREVSGELGYRSGSSYRHGDSTRMGDRHGMGGYMPSYPSYRDEDEYEEMGERRRRDSRGRYM